MRVGRLRSTMPDPQPRRRHRPVMAAAVGLTVMIAVLSTVGSRDNSDAAPTKWTRATTTIDTTPPPPATATIAPATSAPGGAILLVAGGWYAGSAITVTISPTSTGKGTSRTYQWRVDAAGTVRETFAAPSPSGLWKVCTKGFNKIQRVVTDCHNLIVTGTAAATSGTASADMAGAPTSAPTTTLPRSDAGVPPTAEQDGITPVQETTSAAKPGSHAMLWVIEGLIAAIGLVVSYFMHHGNPTRHRRRVGSLILLVMVGGPLMAAIFVSPGPSTAPTLGLVRVQKTVPLSRSKTDTTVSATCPVGDVVLGGGFVTDWKSDDRTSLDPLIGWLETTKLNSSVSGELTFVRSLKWTSKRATGTEPVEQYQKWSRADGTMHLADQIYDSQQETWKSVHDRSQPGGEALTKDYIAHNDETMIATADTYYTVLDSQPAARGVGVLISESRPYAGEWRVVGHLAESSMQPEVLLTVVAVCAPSTTKSSHSGVRGARIVAASSGNNSAGATHCRADEAATSIGWQVGPVRGVAEASIDGATQSGRVYTGTASGNTAVLVCVPSKNISTTTATKSAIVEGGRDAGVKVSCPAGSFVLGGGLSTSLTAPDGSKKNVPHSVLWAAPFDDTTWSVKVRGVVRAADVKVPTATENGKAGEDGTGDFHVWSVDSFTKNDRTDFTADVVCGRRI